MPALLLHFSSKLKTSDKMQRARKSRLIMTVERAAQIILIIGIVCIVGYWYPKNWFAYGFVQVFYAPISSSLLSISLTVLLIDRLHDQRERAELKLRLIREMGSSDRSVAVRASREIRAYDWLLDGSLKSMDFEFANLDGANLENAELSGANLKNSSLRAANLQGARLAGVQLSRCVADEVNLKGAILCGADMSRSNFPKATLDDANISGRVDLLHAQFIEASLRNTKLGEAKLEDCDFLDCDLSYADLTEAVLLRANFEGANLTGTKLERADLSGIIGWKKIVSMKGAHIAGVKNAPDGFREFAESLQAIID